MSEWLEQVWQNLHEPGTVPLELLVPRLLAAFGLGCLAAAVRYLTTKRATQKTERGLLCTLVMLAVLVALLMLVVGNSQARAFTLVGALAIVRFRTVMEDTRDTAFVIYAVVSGMAAGTGYPEGALVCTPLVLVTAWVFRPRGTDVAAVEGTLALRLGTGQAPLEGVQAVLKEYLGRYRLTSMSTARGGSALDVTYAVRLPAPERVFDLVTRLNAVEGVQGVELKER